LRAGLQDRCPTTQVISRSLLGSRTAARRAPRGTSAAEPRGGISPPRALRTLREALHSYGSDSGAGPMPNCFPALAPVPVNSIQPAHPTSSPPGLTRGSIAQEVFMRRRWIAGSSLVKPGNDELIMAFKRTNIASAGIPSRAIPTRMPRTPRAPRRAPNTRPAAKAARAPSYRHRIRQLARSSGAEPDQKFWNAWRDPIAHGIAGAARATRG
jgi:hypothetical protein